MTVDDAATRTRRARRDRASDSADLSAESRVALTWVDDEGRPTTAPPASPGTASFELLPPMRRRRQIRGRVIGIPALAILALVTMYTSAMLLWPLSSTTPTAKTTDTEPLTGAASAIAWPADGEAAVGIDGFASATSSADPAQMASTAKLVTALMILDAAPLAAGEQGPAYEFTFADRQEYWRYVAENQSALNVPDDGSLTEYQMLQGMLIASASNYADRLATDAFGSIDEYATAANAWLAKNGIDGITVTDASGYSRDNVATPAAMIALAEKALENPVIAEIVKTESVELPGAGTFENTNALLGTDGVVGLKTGSYAGYYNLLAARTVDLAGTPTTVFASVAGQPTDSDRADEAERLLGAVAAEAATPSTLAAGTVVGEVTTPWGASSRIVTEKEASLLLWNGASAEPSASFDVDSDATAGTDAGTLTLTGPAAKVEVPLGLEKTLPGPDAWWRLTHPLELVGATD
ncbi:D-alanyl-D-alanine carboxypeptidase [Microbacterium sp. MM2322]|uniref:D-alanyl-D-alanine carboxypeptidase family protein n=1 Tax=Microbacterium sp. MM2322 TaxID=3157631 RepID=UPI0032D577DA